MTQLPAIYPEDALPPNTQINSYTIKSVLGRGTFGITYLAEETHLERLVAIKEYLPEMAATREDGSQVIAKPGKMGQLFHQELANFLEEAKTLVKFNHTNIVRVLTYFQALGTAYLVMEYEVGMDLTEHLKQHPEPSEQTLLDIFSPIVQGLVAVHASGYIHRDIKAGNIYIREDNSPVLLDFGAARNVISADVNQLTRILTVGYAPYEQDNPSWSEQGPWTDIYALAATLYFCILSKRPVSSTERAGAIFGGQKDPILSIMSVRPAGYSLPFLSAIDKALRFKPEERPQTALEWDAMLNDVDTDKTVLASSAFESNSTATEKTPALHAGLMTSKVKEPKSSKLVPGIVALSLIGVAAYFFLPSLLSTPDNIESKTPGLPIDNSNAESSAALVEIAEPTGSKPQAEKPAIVDPDEFVAAETDEAASPALEEETAKEQERLKAEQQAKEEAFALATLEQSKSTVLSCLLLGKTAVWHFARGEKINNLIEQIKSLPETADRTRFIVDQETKKRQSDEGFNSNFADYQSAINMLKKLGKTDIESALENLFTQPRYAEDQTYRLLSQLIKKHASSDETDSNTIRTDLIELSRSNAFIDS